MARSNEYTDSCVGKYRHFGPLLVVIRPALRDARRCHFSPPLRNHKDDGIARQLR